MFLLIKSLQQYVNRELPDVQGGFRKGRGTRDQNGTKDLNVGSSKKQDNSRKTSTSSSLITLKTFCDHNKLWEILKEMGISEHPTCLLQNLYACQETTVRTVYGKIGSKLRKEAVYCHSVYLTSMQSISCKMLGWMNHKLKSRLPGEISTSHMPIIHSNGRK